MALELHSGFDAKGLISGANIDMSGTISGGNIYSAGILSGANLYGDGSNITNITVSGDDLGNHTATAQLNMAGFGISGASTISGASLITKKLELYEATDSNAPNPTITKIAHASISRMLLAPEGGNAQMNAFYAPSGTQDQSTIQIRNDSNSLGSGRVMFNIDGAAASLETSSFNNGHAPDVVTTFSIGERAGTTDLTVINFNIPGGTTAMKIESDGGVHITNMKSGTTQANARADAGELWADSDDDYTVKIGI